MSKYIGTPVVNLSVDTVDVTGDITATDSTPELILLNDTHEDTDGGREGKVTFKGEQSGGEVTVLAQIQSSHDGTSDDQKGDLIFKTNDGSDGASPTERLRIDSAGTASFDGTVSVIGDFHTSGSGVGTQLAFANDHNTDKFYVGLEGNTSGDAFLYQQKNADINFYTNNAFRAKLDNDGNLGIGLTAPTAPLTVKSPTNAEAIHVVGRSDDIGQIKFFEADHTTILSTIEARNSFVNLGSVANIPLQFMTQNTERARFDGDGNFGIATDANLSLTTSEEGLWYQRNDWFVVARDGGKVAYFNRLSDDGEVVEVRRNGSAVGHLGANGGYLYVGSGNVNLRFHNGADAILPATSSGASRDNVIDMGSSGARFDDIFATNSSIQTSDETEKQDISSLTSAEITAATAISKLFKTYKWKDKVAAKGDDARTHTGVVAQQVQSAMSDAGLDASKYAFWCSNTWWEKDVEVAAVEADEEEGIEAKDAYTRTDTYDTKDAAPEGATEHTRLGVRYPELLAFIGAATEQRLTSIEARLTALEGE